MKIKLPKIHVNEIVPDDKYLEEYIVDFLNRNIEKDNWFTSFLKRYYAVYDKTLNLVDTYIYLRSLDYTIWFIFFICYSFIDCFIVLKNSYRMVEPEKIDFLLTSSERWVLFSNYDSYLGVIIIKGILLVFFFLVASLEIRKIWFLHTRIIGLDNDVRLYIYYEKIKSILSWVILVLMFCFIAPTSSIH